MAPLDRSVTISGMGPHATHVFMHVSSKLPHCQPLVEQTLWPGSHMHRLLVHVWPVAQAAH
jgi:hypothetical protein